MDDLTLKEQLKKHQIQIVGLMNRWEGTRKLYDAACMMNQAETSDALRQQLHDILDMQLDLVAASTSITLLILNNKES